VEATNCHRGQEPLPLGLACFAAEEQVDYAAVTVTPAVYRRMRKFCEAGRRRIPGDEVSGVGRRRMAEKLYQRPREYQPPVKIGPGNESSSPGQ
jgi:hypothetical protein